MNKPFLSLLPIAFAVGVCIIGTSGSHNSDVLSFDQTDYCTFLCSLTKTPGYLDPTASTIADSAKFISRGFYDIPRDA